MIGKFINMNLLNITSIRKKSVQLLFVSLVISLNLNAQNSDTTYKVNAVIGLGYSYFISSLTEFDGYNPHSYNATLKIMWQPEHLLRVGLESGFLSLYTVNQNEFNSEYGKTNIDLSLSAIPIILLFTMEFFEDFEISSGVGVYFLFNNIDSHDNKVSNSVFSNGYYSSLAYYYPLSKDFKIGGELKYYYISKIEDADISMQLSVKYNLLEY